MAFYKRSLLVLVLVLVLLASKSLLAIPSLASIFQAVPLDFGTTPLASLVNGVPYDTEGALISMINTATSRLDVEMMYFADDAVTPSPSSFDPVFNAILNAAIRGVDVRVLVDAQFYDGRSASYTTYVDRLATTPHAQARTLDYTQMTGAGIVHSKFFVADGQTAYVGSSNFDWRAIGGTPNPGAHNGDDGMRVDDCSVGRSLVSMFDIDWTLGTPVVGSTTYTARPLPTCSVTGTTGVTVALSPNTTAFNPTGIPYTLDRIVNQINSARSSVQVVVYKFTSFNYTTYQNDWYPLFDALRAAANRGVRVNVIVDKSSAAYASDLADLRTLDGTPNAQVRVITLPDYYTDSTRTTVIPIAFGRVIHDKFMLVDYQSSTSPNPNSGYLGNENWERGYFLESRNASVSFSGNLSLAQSLNAMFTSLWNLPCPQAARAATYPGCF